MKDLLLKIADKLRQKGHEYYDKGEKDKTAIFWELELILRDIARKESNEKLNLGFMDEP